MLKGSCLCGKVSFAVEGKLAPVEACHCTMCRKWTSHFLASTEVPRAALKINDSNLVSWFRSSEKVRRGFCSTCGSPLFFDPVDKEKHAWIGVSMGAIESPTGTEMALHIFTSEKGDYYEIMDGLPQNET